MRVRRREAHLRPCQSLTPLQQANEMFIKDEAKLALELHAILGLDQCVRT